MLGASQRGNGCYSGAGVVVTWCIGHLVEAVPPEGYGEQYKRWAIEQLPILPERWRVEPKAATAAQFKVVQQLVAKAGELVIATDADREGDDRPRDHRPMRLPRADSAPVAVGAQRCVDPQGTGAPQPSAETLPLYFSALARSRADWLIGMNLSRLFTLLGARPAIPACCRWARADADAEVGRRPRSRDRAPRLRAVLGQWTCYPMPASPSPRAGYRPAAARMQGSLPSAAGGAGLRIAFARHAMRRSCR